MRGATCVCERVHAVNLHAYFSLVPFKSSVLRAEVYASIASSITRAQLPTTTGNASKGTHHGKLPRARALVAEQKSSPGKAFVFWLVHITMRSCLQHS
jgi:hypothetical protein